MPSQMATQPLGALPSGFFTVRDILDEKKPAGSFVNIMGVVHNAQDAIPTRGTDYKMAIHFIDKSVDEDGQDETLTLHMFLPQGDMPDIQCHDIIVLHTVKVQSHTGDMSLITNRQTKFSLLTHEKIPKPPGDPTAALATTAKSQQRTLTKSELDYVAYLAHNINKNRLPAKEEFEVTKLQSRNVREKFRELKDVKDRDFVDLIVQVVKEPYDLGDKMTLYVSDYTENPAFFNYKDPGATGGKKEEDPYGYGYHDRLEQKKADKAMAEHSGPFGQKTLQITCWEPHVTAIKGGHIKKGTWVQIKNLQIKYGHSNANLEGYLREDTNAHGVKLQIIALGTDDRDSMDPRLHAALLRHRDHDRARKLHRKDIDEAAEAGKKRKSQGATEEPAREGTKARRRNRRKNKQQQDQQSKSDNAAVSQQPEQQLEQQPEQQPEPVSPVVTPNLNVNVKCENHTKPPSKVSTLLRRITTPAEILGRTIDIGLPFVNLNYRVDVRVVDFWPPNLKEFAHPKKASKYGALSDDGESDYSSDSGGEDMMMAGFTAEWEWSFSLQLEDATPDASPKERFWVVVGNQDAQCLTGLDASNLKYDSSKLKELSECMFVLWGNLEEHKRSQKKLRSKPTARDMPPPHSDDEQTEEPASKLSNRPFSCCVRQYGVKTKETDPAKADAGKGYRWARMFGLYGTIIKYASSGEAALM